MIAGHDPGRSDGLPLHNVHVTGQVGRDAVGPARGDADRARWKVDVRPLLSGDGVDLFGLAAHERRGERFLYLTWGDVGVGGSFTMFRRCKLMIAAINPEMLAAAARDDGVLVASLSLTDERGVPRCARFHPPSITWRAPAESPTGRRRGGTQRGDSALSDGVRDRPARWRSGAVR